MSEQKFSNSCHYYLLRMTTYIFYASFPVSGLVGFVPSMVL